MVAEGLVLLAVQHFEERRGRVAVRVLGQLVDLVEKQERIVDAGLREGCDDPPGHGSDVGFAVAADVGLVAHAAQRNAGVLAVGRAGDRGSDRGLAHAGRADEAEDLVLERGIPFLCGHEFHNALLDLFKSVVVFVQDLLHLFKADDALGRLAPRDFETGVEVARDHGRLGRAVGRFGKAIFFLVEFFLDLFWQVRLFDLFGVFFNVRAFSELFFDDLDLFAQVVFALVAVHALVDLLPDDRFLFKDIGLGGKDLKQSLGAGKGIEAFEDLELVFGAYDEVCGNEIGKIAGICIELCGREKILGISRQKLCVFFKRGKHFMDERLALDAAPVGERDRLAEQVGLHVVPGLTVGGHGRTHHAFGNDARGAFGRTDHLFDAHHTADPAEGKTVLGFSVRAVGGQKEECRSRFCGGDRFLGIYFKIERDPGEGHGVAQGNHRQKNRFHFFEIGGHFNGSFRDK